MGRPNRDVLLLVLLPLAGAFQHGGQVVTDSLLASFAFPRTECLSGLFLDDEPSTLNVFSFLRRDMATTTCLNGTGVRADRAASGPLAAHAVSTTNASSLVSALSSSVLAGSDGITVEFWMERGDNRHASASIERPLVSIADVGSTRCELGGVGLRVSEYDDGDIFVDYRFDDGNGMSFCAEAFTETSVPPSPLASVSGPYVHLVAVFGEDFELYLNGTLAHSSVLLGFDRLTGQKIDYSSQRYEEWDAANLRLQLFSDGNSRWAGAHENGTIHALRLYSKRLNASEVRRNYEQNIRNSPPVVLNVSVTINEDGEAVPGSLPPEYYSTKLPQHALGGVVLNAVDVDDLAGHPNQRDPYVRGHPMRMVIVRGPTLPGTELLVPGNSTPIGDGDEVPRQRNGSFVVLIRPPHNYVGELSFSLRAVDGATGVASATVGVVDALVVAVDDPPAGTSLNFTARAGATTFLAFDASVTDPDNGERVVGAIIESCPANATLRQVVVVNGTTVATGPSLGVGSYISGLSVAYKYTGVAAVAASDGTVARDAFSLAPVSQNGAVGAAFDVGVEVLTNIVALPTSRPQTLYEDEAGIVTLSAMAQSDDEIDICFEVLVPDGPRESQPQLHDPALNGTRLEPGRAVLATREPSSRGRAVSAAVSYVGVKDFFTTPEVAWSGSSLMLDDVWVTYVAFDCALPSGRSLETRQSIEITNVADPPNISITPAEFSIYALSSMPSDDEYPTHVSLADQAVVTLSDVDRDVDAVRIDATCATGMLSLDGDMLHLADFNSQRLCQSSGAARSWFCRGSGSDDRRMTFIATPVDAATLLSGLSYYSLESEVDDTVTLSIYDGADPDGESGCLLESQFRTASSRRSCAVTETHFVVHVREFAFEAAAKDTADSNSVVSWELHLALVAAVFILLCCCCCYVRRGYRRQLRVKKNKIRTHNAATTAPPHTPKKEEDREIDTSSEPAF